MKYIVYYHVDTLLGFLSIPTANHMAVFNRIIYHSEKANHRFIGIGTISWNVNDDSEFIVVPEKEFDVNGLFMFNKTDRLIKYETN